MSEISEISDKTKTLTIIYKDKNIRKTIPIPESYDDFLVKFLEMFKEDKNKQYNFYYFLDDDEEEDNKINKYYKKLY